MEEKKKWKFARIMAGFSLTKTAKSAAPTTKRTKKNQGGDRTKYMTQIANHGPGAKDENKKSTSLYM